ncbi:PTS system, mannitol-specific IIA component [Williamsoniiplasma somnilux]|uniref:Mannitol-specific phosphotransferase enzyme IIA component n=1 Tax=Williamsoniiplasma somnilux TaxID=215578 RepID=A0A2K8NXZ6_9MOLU|nr:PTS sugar transporter subunit IIA [Williamsoniiplasma somnilux]ATZ18690.1 PTS system, mannitol-specific IIA component [Williamsoniiplasma somnilux]
MKKVLELENIKVNLNSVSKEEAIRFAGEHLLNLGYVQKEYIDSMLRRENNLTTYIGNHVAIPHGDTGSASLVKTTGIVFHHYKKGVDFGKEKAHFIIGIASKDNYHLEILANIAEIFSDADLVKSFLKKEVTVEKVFKLLQGE